MSGAQGELFAPEALPDGLVYRPDWLDAQEEAALLAIIATLPLQPARYKGYTAKRRVASYGSHDDIDANARQPGTALPAALEPLRDKAARWLGVAPEELRHALVAEYRPGTALGWHRDAPDYERVFGTSLASPCRMRLRPWPPRAPKRTGVIELELAPRSAYLLQGEARWRWQHAIAPTPSLRYSITLRTANPRYKG